MKFAFEHPWVLAALLVLPLLAWLKGKFEKRPAFLYSSVGLVRTIAARTRRDPGAILRALRWLALAAFIVALARPRFVEGEAQVSASGIDIVVCMDLSTSMQAEDFFNEKDERINRLAMAKDVVEKFVTKRPSDRIGLIAFAGRAYLAAPLTLDHDFLITNLERLSFDGIEDGTAIGSGLIAGVNRLRELKSKSKIVILMTDGQNNAGQVQPVTAAEAAEVLGVKVYTIGVGTRGHAPMPRRDPFGRQVYVNMKVDIDEDTLRESSDKTGGKYYRADSASTLRTIYDEIDQLEKTTVVVKKFLRYRELMHWAIGIGLAMLIAEMVLANTWLRRLP